MSGPLVVKLGGRSLDGDGAVAALAADLRALARPTVIVHGGGAEVTAWSARLGHAARFDGGRRITDAATLDVAAAVLAGLANKRLVAGLRHAGVDALGLSALDGGIAACAPHADAAVLGAVGAVRAIRGDRVKAWLSAGMVPVLASLGAHDGALLNLNADDLAAAVAAGIGAGALLLVSDTDGLVLDGARVEALDAAGLERARAHADVSGGMGPKLTAAAAALAGGVPRTWIGAWSGIGTLPAALDGRAGGTTIAASAAVLAVAR